MDRPAFQPLAAIEIDAVTPSREGFTLTGQGAGGRWGEGGRGAPGATGGTDLAEYRLDVHFDLPLDPRTRAVLGELFSHSELTISRRAAGGVRRALRATRNS